MFRSSLDRLEAVGVLFGHRIFRFLLMALVFCFLGSRLDAKSLLAALRGFMPGYGLAMIVVFALLLGLFALRWWLVGQQLGVSGSYRRYVLGLWFSQAVGELGPPLVVGELARFHALKGLADPGRLGLSQLLDRCIGTIVLWVLVGFMMPFYRSTFEPFMTDVWSQFVAGCLVMSGLGVLIILISRLWKGGLILRDQVLRCLNPLSNPLVYLLSLLIQLLLILNLVLAAAGLGLQGPNLVKVAWMGPLLLLGVSLLPGLVSDWGKREALAIVLLAPAGLSPEGALAVSLLFGGGHWLVAVPGIFSLRGPLRQETSPSE